MGNEVFIIGGTIGAGKSTLAKQIKYYLFRSSKDTFPIHSFATEVKRLVAAYYGITTTELEANKAKYRADLQKLATEAIRNHYRGDYWARYLVNTVSCQSIIIDDLRYKNELDVARDAFLIVHPIWIDAPLKLREDRRQENLVEAQKHCSEQSFTGDEGFWEARFWNDGNINRLKEETQAYIDSVVKKRKGK